jgi:hypothetical protein
MTPVELFWLVPDEEKRDGAMSMDWLREQKAKYADGNGTTGHNG